MEPEEEPPNAEHESDAAADEQPKEKNRVFKYHAVISVVIVLLAVILHPQKTGLVFWGVAVCG